MHKMLTLNNPIMKKIIILALIAFSCRSSEQTRPNYYPEDCYYHNHRGGWIIDVTKPPFNAHNDGSHPQETTAALIAAYDSAISEFTDFNIRPAILFFPAGTYRVNNTIIYSHDIRTHPNGHEILNNIRFQGEDRNRTIIRLDNFCPEFQDMRQPRPVVSFGKGEKNNAVAANKFENFTIDIGKGNPGAIGILFHGANVASLRDVTVMTSDSRNAGAIGIDMSIDVTQGVIMDTEVRGFDTGIRMTSDLATHPTFEHITLKGQRSAGFFMGPGSCSIRKLNSINTVPAIRFTDPKGHLVIIDSDLMGGKEGNPAIDLATGNIFARNIRSEGYGNLITGNEGILVEGPVMEGEYFNGKPLTLFEENKSSSLNLPVMETPDFPWEIDMSKWAGVHEFGAVPNDTIDDSPAIQAALAAGPTEVYFLGGRYVMASPVKVPAHVRAIHFFYSELRSAPPLQNSFEGAFVIEDNPDQALLLEEFFVDWHTQSQHYWIDHASTRTLVLRNIVNQRSPLYINSVEGGKVFIETVHSNRNEQSVRKIDFELYGQKVWCRDVNPEHTSGWEMLVDHSDVWVLGYKTEFNQRQKSKGVFKVVNGGKLEVLGGLMNNFSSRIDPDITYILNDNSNVSFVAREWGRDEESAVFKTVVTEVRDRETRYLRHTETPRRGDEKWNQLIPLYAGWR